MTKLRKVDRRTVYTISVIKDSFLELIAQETYDKLTVAKVCRKAEITRSTFYLHFDNLTAVLDAVLADALLFDQSPKQALEPLTSIEAFKQNESLLPVCQRIGATSKYQKLLMDPALSDYIIGAIMKHERANVVPGIQAQTGLNAQDADLLFHYMIHGSFAINKQHHFVKDDAWYHELQLLNKFINSGYLAFKQDV
ncbi:TetR/AcrR family transcriptional regulator [Agrilactobacillus yilanensis]|uniref:TetR/AcrR family transcriptional regulator n=1 Tax=Agrilactobacillus yilanensis TaxID=2485997 RepID=A0ABW4J6W5_9LACO|nr:TetR/AcrR family transcriptional regulator [Agrilactobacillus yilanensis]